MNNDRQYAQYADFKKEQLALADMISEASGVMESLDMNRFRDNLAALSETVKNDSFKVQIVGTFKNGKSTFINSLLGEEIMPAYARPCTAIVNEIKWGEKKRAVVHFRNPVPEKLPSNIPPLSLSHMNKHGMKDIPPLEVPYNELESYAVIPLNNGSDEFDFQSPYEKIEVFWPLEILKNGVEIVDSPGLNESLTRTEVTMNYISKADALLFVLDATRLLSADEMRIIDTTVKMYGFSDPFIIINKFDTICDAEKGKMRDYVQLKLGDYTTKEFHFVSAANALDGKLDHDDFLLKSSGIPEFEKALAHFLVKEKGRAKLSRPIRELKRIIGEEALFKVIPMQKSALSGSIEELNRKYDEAKPKLEALKMQKQSIYEGFVNKIERSRYSFVSLATKNMMNLKNNIPGWVEQSVPTTSLGIVPTKQKLTRAAQEITKYLGEQIESDQLNWRTSVFQPALLAETKKIFDESQPEVQSFFESIDNIALEVSGGTAKTVDGNVWQRASDLASGIKIGNKRFSPQSGAPVVSGEVMIALSAQIVASVILGVLNVVNPIALVLLFVGGAAFGALKSEFDIMKKLKTSISCDAVEHISQMALDFPKEISQRIIDELSETAKTISSAMDTEINETESRICNMIEEMQKGKENVEEKKALLSECEDHIKQLITKLDDLSYRLTV